MSLVNIIKKGINLFNIDIKKHPEIDLRRRQKPIAHFKINKILDVGANMGQYAQLARKLGFQGDIVFLKIDVQGFEKNIIEGASLVLQKIKGIQIEMSLAELYEQEMLFFEMSNLLTGFGFKLYSLENGFYNLYTGQLLQVDRIFFKEDI